ncbi:diphosphomevalonate/mevalonate 3,5-bisphosphate decarboxylase family protein [Robertkochia aurantiaca]|uniref:diphosphomevalonate/mevalonate 3,5-bisphosphate decarboxylase family protein n=1 Tax=Robertkochia aurantiaca TaxID=2873700 RepID=UPI001CCA4734|nr:diphosphomevalonate decarboxylase [Robertkochia sp. 3YJGBD-33]
MIANDFIPAPYNFEAGSGEVTWQAPSNIAIVKYWGKKEGQIPANPSLSFTLDKSLTETRMSWEPKKAGGVSFDFFFEGKEKASFRPKLEQFFDRIRPYQPFIESFHLTINSSNTFPHSSGIASSASGMSALALCLTHLERQISEMTEEHFNRKASFLARLGSGSACRSIEGPLMSWGEHRDIKGSSDLFGLRYTEPLHDIFKDYQDTILLIDKGSKKMSSTAGHQLMHGHPFAAERFSQAHRHIAELKPLLATGDLEAFIFLMEREALTLHAMMMTSDPYFILMQPATLEVINKVWEYRRETGTPLGFTLDAGANVHLLYPADNKDEILKFIEAELVAYCENRQYICDRIGFGAKKL